MKEKKAPKVRVIASVAVSPNDVPYVRGYLRGVMESLFRSIPVWAFDVTENEEEE